MPTRPSEARERDAKRDCSYAHGGFFPAIALSDYCSPVSRVKISEDCELAERIQKGGLTAARNIMQLVTDSPSLVAAVASRRCHTDGDLPWKLEEQEAN